MSLTLNKPRQHKELSHLIVVPLERVVIHDPFKTKFQDTVCYKCEVINGLGIVKYKELFTEKYLTNDFKSVSIKG